MFINCIVLSISSSIDSLGIGITYGIKNTKISLLSKIILLCISLFVSFISVSFGNFLTFILSETFTNLIGGFILFLIGVFVIVKSFFDTNSTNNNYYDFNHSNLIDPKEAIFLGLALSLDSFGIGVSSSLIGSNSLLFPLLVSIFQFIFLSFGVKLGKKINKLSKISDFIWTLISGILLICIGLIRLLWFYWFPFTFMAFFDIFILIYIIELCLIYLSNFWDFVIVNDVLLFEIYCVLTYKVRK